MDNEQIFVAFIGGFLIGIITTVIILSSVLSDKEIIITTDKKISPEWKLTTDGKKIDTLYIYKQK